MNPKDLANYISRVENRVIALENSTKDYIKKHPAEDTLILLDTVKLVSDRVNELEAARENQRDFNQQVIPIIENFKEDKVVLKEPAKKSLWDKLLRR